LPVTFKWGARKSDAPPETTPVPEPAAAPSTSKVLPRLISALAQRPAPVLLDLGPVIGSNIAFFGDRLACKIHVEDLFNEVEQYARKANRDGLAASLVGRLTHPPESIDGVLCWDLFDYLDNAAGKALASRLAELLRPGGVLYGFFGTTPVDLMHYTRFAVVSENTFRQKAYPATVVRRNVLLTRDINRMFEGLVVAESVLLKSSTRETLFRKP
jgi:methyltransferase family protein